jgi:hypothetical protein
MNLTDEQSAVVTSLRRGEAAAYAEGVESPVLVKVPRVDFTGTASDDDVAAAARRFYERHPQVLRPMPGCLSCPNVCHHAPAAKRLADNPEVRGAVWAYVVGCLRNPGSATRTWPALVDRLLTPTRAGTTRVAQREAFAACVCHLTAERALSELRERGIPLSDVAALLTSFAQMCVAIHDHSDDAVARVSQFRVKANRSLQLDVGPLQGCVACRARCQFRALGAMVAMRREFSERLLTAYRAKEPDAAVQRCCQQAAADILFTVDAETIHGLALCIYAHAAHRAGARTAAETTRRLFESGKSESP